MIGKRTVELVFERSCNVDECDVRGTDLDGGGDSGVEATPESTVADGDDVSVGGTLRTQSGRFGVVDAGVAESIGKRGSMEDTHILTSFTATPRLASGAAADNGAVPATYILAAAFDGHRGAAGATYAAEKLPDAVRRAVERGEPSPLAAAWRQVADGYTATGLQDGACATMVLVGVDGRVEMINCGDSRTMLAATAAVEVAGGDSDDEEKAAAGGGAACVVEMATRDHAAEDELEGARITNFGGRVKCAAGGSMRVQVDSPEGKWQVAVARALGGSQWKGGGITDAADVTMVRLKPRHRFLVLATDGITGPLDDSGRFDFAERSEPIAWRVAAAQDAGTRAAAIAEALVACADREGGTDNATCIVLLLGEA